MKVVECGVECIVVAGRVRDQRGESKAVKEQKGRK